MPGLTPDQVQQIHNLLHERKMIQAVRLYHDATGVSLAEAKESVEAMARNEFTKPPSGVRSYDDPVLEGKIRSLLSKGKKLEAVKIYRAEYGTSLGEAQNAVERIAATLPRQLSTARPPESAIGSDPFAEDDAGRRRIIVLAIALLIGLCALGGFLWSLLSTL